MQVDPGLDVHPSLSGVEEHGGELDAELQVVRAPAPLPPVPGGAPGAGEGLRLAAAGQQIALAAGPSYAVSDPGG